VFARRSTHRLFMALACGLILADRGTVTGMAATAGIGRQWRRACWFFAAAAWDADALGLAVARLIVKYLLSEGDPVVVAVDGTFFRRWGRQAFILSFCVSRGCDLRRPVADTVADGTLASWSRVFQPPRSLPDRSPADRWSPSARASWQWSRAFSSASCLLRSRAAASRERRDASVARWAAGTAPAGTAPSVFFRSLRIWPLRSGWV
jgi:hypothetical protein